MNAYIKAVPWIRAATLWWNGIYNVAIKTLLLL